MGYQACAPRGAVNGRPSPTPATSTRNSDLQASHQQQTQPTADTMAATPWKMGSEKLAWPNAAQCAFWRSPGTVNHKDNSGDHAESHRAPAQFGACTDVYCAAQDASSLFFVILCAGWLPGCGSDLKAPESAVIGWTCCPHPTRANSEIIGEFVFGDLTRANNSRVLLLSSRRDLSDSDSKLCS